MKHSLDTELMGYTHLKLFAKTSWEPEEILNNSSVHTNSTHILLLNKEYPQAMACKIHLTLLSTRTPHCLFLLILLSRYECFGKICIFRNYLLKVSKSTQKFIPSFSRGLWLSEKSPFKAVGPRLQTEPKKSSLCWHNWLRQTSGLTKNWNVKLLHQSGRSDKALPLNWVKQHRKYIQHFLQQPPPFLSGTAVLWEAKSLLSNVKFLFAFCSFTDLLTSKGPLELS